MRKASTTAESATTSRKLFIWYFSSDFMSKIGSLSGLASAAAPK